MNNSILLDEITYWNNYIASMSEKNDRILELAFFKIFVKFELFITDAFIEYSTGGVSDRGYVAERALNFRDRAHLDNVLKLSGGSFIDYYNSIEKVSKQVFEVEKDPFFVIFSASNYSPEILSMKVIRNQIAHESESSKSRYVKSVLGNRGYIEPYEHLAKMKKSKSKTFYSYYVDLLVEISEVLLNPTDFLSDIS